MDKIELGDGGWRRIRGAAVAEAVNDGWAMCLPCDLREWTVVMRDPREGRIDQSGFSIRITPHTCHISTRHR